MPMLMIRPARHAFHPQQKNWGAELVQSWRRWRLRWARHSQRKALRDLIDDPHLLADIGVTREEALHEAGKSVFDLTIRANLPPREPILHAREWANSHRPRY